MNLNISVSGHELRFLCDRTGAATVEEVLSDALSLYKVAVLGAMKGEILALVKQIDDQTYEFEELDLADGPLAYASGNADIPSMTKTEVNTAFCKFVERQKKAA